MSELIFAGRPHWQIQIDVLESYYRLFYEDEFLIWAHHIDDIHGREAERIKNALSEALSQIAAQGSSEFDPSEFYSDEYYAIDELTNKMYGALVVTLWSKTEVSLAKLAKIAVVAIGNGTLTNNDIKAITTVLDANLNKKFAIDCPEYKVVNSVRVLANAFKHNDARYDQRTLDGLDAGLTTKLIPELNKSIEYSKLNFDELAASCKRAIEWIVNEIRNEAT